MDYTVWTLIEWLAVVSVPLTTLAGLIEVWRVWRRCEALIRDYDDLTRRR